MPNKGTPKFIPALPGTVVPRLEVDTFFNDTGAALTAGDWVSLDLSSTDYGIGNSIKQAPATANGPVTGVLLGALADQEWGSVLIWGITDIANVATGVAADKLLQMSGTAGRAEETGATSEKSIGLVLVTAAGNVATVFVGM